MSTPVAELPRSPQDPGFVVVEDDLILANSFGRVLARLGRVRLAYSVREGLEALRAERCLAALFLDWQLGDGTGADVLGPCRELHPYLPILVVTALQTTPITNLALDHRAFVMAKTADENPRRIEDFAIHGVNSLLRRAELIDALVRTWTERYGLTGRDSCLLREALMGTPRSQLAAALGLAESSIDTYAKRLIQKTGDASLLDAVARGLREIVMAADRLYPQGDSEGERSVVTFARTIKERKRCASKSQ